jgi:AmmeMemoRadiSam system protein B
MNEQLLTVRPSPIAGTWYTANPDQLQKTVESCIKNANPPKLSGEVIGLVSPHAGYRYSGPIAGHAYKTVKGKTYKYVIVISPMHQYYPKPVLTSAHDAYRTPLGEVPLAREKVDEISEALKKDTGIGFSPVANDQEHSLEIQLPFLQCALRGEFSLIPIMLRDQRRQLSRILGAVLAEIFKDESCLFVASSDLSHFYPEEIANQLDNAVLQKVADFSPDGLFNLKDQGKGHACGLAAIASVLWAAKDLGATEVTLLGYDTSASSTGDASSVVGYGAAAITR